jgi:hypothetical protein
MLGTALKDDEIVERGVLTNARIFLVAESDPSISLGRLPAIVR